MYEICIMSIWKKTLSEEESFQAVELYCEKKRLQYYLKELVIMLLIIEFCQICKWLICPETKITDKVSEEGAFVSHKGGQITWCLLHIIANVIIYSFFVTHDNLG